MKKQKGYNYSHQTLLLSALSGTFGRRLRIRPDVRGTRHSQNLEIMRYKIPRAESR